MTEIAERGDPTAGEVALELDRLGTSGDQVARTLKTEGRFGPQGSPYACPLTAALWARFPEAGRIEVTQATVRFRIALDVDMWRPTFVVDLPPACIQFARWHDAGRFPWLLPTVEAEAA